MATALEMFLVQLHKSSLTAEQRGVFALLASLSCSPWKFDVLWNAWPRLAFRHSEANQLLQELVHTAKDNAARAFGAVAFDDFTIFADVVGDSDGSRLLPREAYRLTYLSLRYPVFRARLGDPPHPPFLLTEEQYLSRLLLVTALAGENLQQVSVALEEAAARYEARGKADGVQMCRQNAALLGALRDELIVRQPDAVTQAAFSLLKLSEETVLGNEIVLQWWPLLGPVFWNNLRTNSASATEAEETLGSLKQSLADLEPFAIMNRERPGIDSVFLSLTFLRLAVGLPPPLSHGSLPSDWLEACQESIFWLSEQPHAPPRSIVDALLGHLIQLRRDARLQPVNDAPTAATDSAITWDVLVHARRLVRREISQEQFIESLSRLEMQVLSSPPVEIAALVHLATDHRAEQPELAQAILDAAVHLVDFTENEDLIEWVRTAARPSTFKDAERQQRQGRPDLALIAKINAGQDLLQKGQLIESLRVFETCWHELGQIEAGAIRIPAEAMFPREEVRLQLARAWASALQQTGQIREALKVLQEVLALCRDLPADLRCDVALLSSWIDLQMSAAALEAQLRGDEVAEARLQKALEVAERTGLHQAAALLLTNLSVIARRRAASAQQQQFLQRAQAHAEAARRSVPYEVEKVRVTESLQAPYAWASEDAVLADRPWEALAAIEGLRSRALLDLLGLCRAIPLPATLAPMLHGQIERTLDDLRSAALPGEGVDSAVLLSHYRESLELIQRQAGGLATFDPEYEALLQGQAMDAPTLRAWAASFTRPTAIVFFMLGGSYSYQMVLLAGQKGSAPALSVRKTMLTLSWLDEAARAFQQAVRQRQDPPARLFADLSQRLIAPIEDLLNSTEVIYFCPAQQLHALPLTALSLKGQPLNTIKETAVAPTASVLRVLQRLRRVHSSSAGSVVYGPQFPHHAMDVARLLGTEPTPELFNAASGQPTAEAAGARLLHILCHGSHDADDPWSCGFKFISLAGKQVLSGRQLMQWQLQAQLVVLEACDTRRQSVTLADDGFGLGRFLHMAGAPLLLLSDWEVRSDVSAVFMKTFYDQLSARPAAHGAAYRAAVAVSRDLVGPEHPFLWAPFTLVGALE